MQADCLIDSDVSVSETGEGSTISQDHPPAASSASKGEIVSSSVWAYIRVSGRGYPPDPAPIGAPGESILGALIGKAVVAALRCLLDT